MTRTVSWPDEYEALIGRLPDLVERSRLTVGGFSACVDVYLSVREALGRLGAAARHCPEGAALLAELERRTVSGIGGELFIDWPDGPGWIDRHATGRRAVGGTSAQAAYMLAHLGAPALIALEDRSAGQLAVLHPETLIATDSGVAPVSSAAATGAGRSPHYIFEFTAGERIGASRLPRSSRTIVRLDHTELQRDAAFVRASVENARDAGAGVLCGFNEIPPERAAEELDYAAGVAAAWRKAGLAVVHVELGDFPSSTLRDLTIARLLPAVTSVGMSLSELADLTGEGGTPEPAAIRLADAHGLERVCVHADEWAFAVTRGDAERELDALEMGCLLASARAAHGYFAIPDRLPDSARLCIPPIPTSQRRGGWSVVCCPAPYLEKPAATIGLGDTFLAGTLLVLGGTTSQGSRLRQPPKAVGSAAMNRPAVPPPEPGPSLNLLPFPRGASMYRLDTKLAKIRDGNYAKGDFIIADAKDGDMSNPIPGTGPIRDAQGKFQRFRTRAEFLDVITQIVRQDKVDIMLVSASNLELLTEAGAFKVSAVKPAFRANDTSDIWGARPNGYGKLGPSRPFRTPVLKDVAAAGLSDLGLYSITFVNDIDADLRSLEAFSAFREDAAANGIKYFLEVFNPNVESGIPPESIGEFVNDNLARCLSGVLKDKRPQFLKYPFNGPKALEELVAFDPQLVVGVLGGGAGTNRDTFELIHQAEKYGARVALFGRKINLTESQLDIVHFMRMVADGEIAPLEAVKAYHAALEKKNIASIRSLEEDSKITEVVLKEGASA